MKKTILQLVLLFLVILLCLAGYLLSKRVLDLPFRATNDALHERDASLTLDCLIPAGTYVDEKMTIGEVIGKRIKANAPLYEKAVDPLLESIPLKYRYIAGLMIFLFFVFSFMAFFRVFTFMGYTRALRISLLLAGITYYFLPDLTIGRTDDYIFIGAPILFILIRVYVVKKKKKEKRYLKA